jgi:hypothetical protein
LEQGVEENIWFWKIRGNRACNRGKKWINTSTGETTLTRKRYRWEDDTYVTEIFPWGKGFDSFGLG